jgi:xylulokinase
MRSDIFNLPVQQRENIECGTMGCMLLAGTALGHYDSIGDAFAKTVRARKTFEPDVSRHEKYMSHYEKYEKLYRLMHAFK